MRGPRSLFRQVARNRKGGEREIPRESRDDFRSKSSKLFAGDGSTLTRTKKKKLEVSRKMAVR